MKKTLATLTALAITSLNAQTIDIVPGWQLLGSLSDINVSQTFNKPCIDIVWKFDNEAKSWSAYSPDSSIQNLLYSKNLGLFEIIEKGKGYWLKAKSSCSIDTAPTPRLYDLLAGKTFYTYQYDEWGIWKSAYHFGKNGILSVIDCQGHNEKWQNCEEPWITNWKIENDTLKLFHKDTNCSFSAEAKYLGSDIEGFTLHIQNVVDSCDPSENCTECENVKFYTTNKTPFEVLKLAFVGKKLQFGNETFYFRQNDIVIADSGDDPTKIASYGSIVDNKLKVSYSGDEEGEYDLVSRNSNGFTIEFFEKSADGIVRANGEVSTSNSLQAYTSEEIEQAMQDK